MGLRSLASGMKTAFMAKDLPDRDGIASIRLQPLLAESPDMGLLIFKYRE